MNLKNFFTLTIRVEDYNLVADRPGFLDQLKKMSFGPGAGLCYELECFEEIRQERKVEAEIITAYSSKELAGWALLSKEFSSFPFCGGKGFDPVQGYLFELFVTPSHRRSGIGTAMMKAAKKRIGSARLCVCPHDQKSTEFFMKNYQIPNDWI